MIELLCRIILLCVEFLSYLFNFLENCSTYQKSISSFEFSIHIKKWWLHRKRNYYLKSYRSRLFSISVRFFFIFTIHLLKSCGIVKLYKICLLLQFSKGSRDWRHHVVYMFAYKGNRVWYKQWKMDYFFVFFFTFKKKFANFLYRKN